MNCACTEGMRRFCACGVSKFQWLRCFTFLVSMAGAVSGFQVSMAKAVSSFNG